MPELKRLFEETGDARLRADLGKLFLAYVHGSPAAQIRVESSQLRAEEVLIASFLSDTPAPEEQSASTVRDAQATLIDAVRPDRPV